MLKRAVPAMFVAAILMAPALYAAEEMLTAAEIEILLAGNTASGDWGGTYKQYFGVDGSTVYAPSSGASDTGRWRVNARNNTYESWWSATGWTAYSISKNGDTFMWIDVKGDKYVFNVYQGNQLRGTSKE